MARLFSARPPPSEDLFYETYYSLSQQYPLLLLLLGIVLCALLAVLAVASASGRVRGQRLVAGLLGAAGGSLPRGRFRGEDLGRGLLFGVRSLLEPRREVPSLARKCSGPGQVPAPLWATVAGPLGTG